MVRNPYKEASICSRPPSIILQSHARTWCLCPPFPLETVPSLLWPAVFPSKGLTICTVLRKAMSDTLPQTTAFHQSPWLQSPVEEDNIQIAFHAITYPRQRQQIQTGCLVTCAVAGEPPSAGSCTILICLCKLLWDGIIVGRISSWVKPINELKTNPPIDLAVLNRASNTAPLHPCDLGRHRQRQISNKVGWVSFLLDSTQRTESTSHPRWMC